MKPFLFYHPDFAIPSFPFMLMMASLVATLYAYYMAPKHKLSQLYILDMGILGTLAALIGGRLFHVFVEEFPYYMEHPSHIYQIWRGGFVSYGAFIGLGIAWYFYLRYRKANIWQYLDHSAVYSCPFIVFFVRVGCLLAGCCFGTPTDSFLHIIFYTGDAAVKHRGIPLHPTQIYEMIYALVIYFILLFWQKRKTYQGQLICMFLMMYAFCRFLLEFLRGDPERGVYFNAISTAQVTGIIAFVFAFILSRYLKKHYPV